MNKFIIASNAPAAIGPYSHASQSGNLLFISGQIGLSPTTSEMVSDEIQGQTKQCLSNLEAILLESGSEIKQILKVVIFLKDMGDFKVVNEIYEAWLQGHRPARSTIAVVGLPKQALVEVECIAAID